MQSVSSVTPAGLLVLLLTLLAVPEPASAQTPPPEPLLPIPTHRQLEWQYSKMNMFLHFGVNTFTDREWGTGEEDPAVFNPADLDPQQWTRVASETGFEILVLTAKHHDGFALWPSRYTDHSVEGSPWRGGEGDVVGALAEAVRDAGLRLGLYLSPWDRHEPVYGDESAYNLFYLGQLRELLTRYGPLAEVWFDGAKGEDAEDMAYHFGAYWALVRQLQPDAVMFSDEGPDVRWIGNERGFAGTTNWSMIDRADVEIGHADTDYLNTGDPQGKDWVPGECDTSIREGWFWHPDEAPKSVDELLEVYFKSVGRNCVLLLNVPPTTRGRLDAQDVERLYQFRDALDAIFDDNLAREASASADRVRGQDARFGADQVLDGDVDTYWATDDGQSSGTIELTLDRRRTIDVVRLKEPIALGQRVSSYHVDVWQDGSWETVSRGTTIGFNRLHRFPSVTTSRVRLVIEDARACPLIAEIGLFDDPRSP